MGQSIFILSHLRSIYNVGSIFRSADVFGVDQLYLVGTTPHPHPDEPWRKDHLRLIKTALGAEQTVRWEYAQDIEGIFLQLKNDSFRIIGLEVTADAGSLWEFVPEPGVSYAFVLGNEVTGLGPYIMKECDELRQIPMTGTKESLNGAVTAGIVMSWLAYQKTLHRGER